MDKYHKKSSEKYKSRSRSKDKKNKWKNRKKSQSSSSHSSEESFGYKLENMRRITIENKRERGYSPIQKKIQINPLNKSYLSSIINDNLKSNKKVDYEEIERASEKLKALDGTITKKVKLILY